MPVMSDPQRIVELEIRASYQEKLIDQLDEVVRELATRLERLERELVQLKESVEPPDVGPANDPPPHY